jgi:hypothetical protein
MLILMLGCRKHHPEYPPHLSEVLSFAKSTSDVEESIWINSKDSKKRYRTPEIFLHLINQGRICKKTRPKNYWNEGLGKKSLEQVKYDISVNMDGYGYSEPEVATLYYNPLENQIYYLYHDEYAQMNEEFRKMMLSLKEKK